MIKKEMLELKPVTFCVYVYVVLQQHGVTPYRGMLRGVLALDSLSDPHGFINGVLESVRKRSQTVAIKIENSVDCSFENIGVSGFGKAIESSDSEYSVDGLMVTDSGIGIHDLSEGREMSKIKVGVIEAERVDTVVRLPAEHAEFEAQRIAMKDVGVGIDVYLTPSQLSEVGLPDDTPPEYIQEVKDLVESSQSKEEVWEAIEKTNLFRWLNTGAVVTTLTVPVNSAITGLLALLGG